MKWASRTKILEEYGMPCRAFDRAVADGLIGSIKFGERQQSTRVFNVGDVERLMMNLAAGRKTSRSVR